MRDGHKLKSIYLDFTNLGHIENPDFLSISKDNNTLLAASIYCSKVYVIDFSTGNVLQVLESDKDKYGFINSLKVSPDCKNALVVFANGIEMINTQTKQIILEKKYSNFEQDAASWLNNYGIGAFNGTGTKVFFANNAGLGVLNSQTGELIKKVSTLPNTHLVGLQQTQDKTHLFSLSSNKYVINWNLLSGALEKSVSTNEKKDGVLYKIAADGKKIIFTNGYEKITELNLKDTTKRIEYTN